MEPSRPLPDKFFFPLLVVLAILLGTGIFLLARRFSGPAARPAPAGKSDVVRKVTPRPSKTSPALILAAPESAGLQPGSIARVLLRADLENKSIVGYDAAVEYDPEYFSFAGADNLLGDSFTMYTRPGEGSVAISSSLKEADTPALSTASSDLAVLQFKVLRPGRSRISLAFEKGSTSDSNLTDTSSRDILEAVTGADMTVGRQMEIAVGQTKEIPGTRYRVKLDSVIKPEDNCADCMAKADLVLLGPEGEGQPFSFSEGGIAGNIPSDVRTGGFLISLSAMTRQNVTIFVVPE